VTKCRGSLSGRARLNVAGLVLAAGGMVLQIAAGSDLFPGIPPGPIVLLAAAVVVTVGPKAWAPYIATVVPVFLIVGGVIASLVNGAFVDQLTGVEEPGILIGSWLQVGGLIAAFVGGMSMWRRAAYLR
jgi:hypothetical protein